ncbi:MAG: hypothetical protein JWP85_2110 [Rhodoglobus sp.]|nr:hypothetical protein [Rhodoglobus sp.]
MSDLNTGTAHAKCMTAGEHICQDPSGRPCIEWPCPNPAGTWWGPLWCPEHDKERLDRISASFDSIRASFRRASTTGSEQ